MNGLLSRAKSKNVADKDAGFKQIPVVISPNSSWSGHRPDLIRQLAQSIAA